MVLIFEEVLENKGSEIDLSFEGIVLDLREELSKVSGECILEDDLFHHDDLRIQLILDVQPARFAVHVIECLYNKLIPFLNSLFWTIIIYLLKTFSLFRHHFVMISLRLQIKMLLRMFNLSC